MRRSMLSSTGFTLLEVLVALTILGLGVVTLLQIFSLGLRLGARSTLRTELAAEGARVMDDLLARRKFPEAAETGPLAGNGKWKAEVQTVRDSPSVLGLSSNWELKELTVDFSWDGGRGQRTELQTFRLVRKGNP